MQSAARRARPVLMWAVNLVLPLVCPVCREPVAGDGGLCAACWGRLQFISVPLCPACGLPFSHAIGEGMCCAACLAAPPPVQPVRSALVYGEGARQLLLPFKHSDRLDLAPILARLTYAAGREAIDGADLLVPVPSHWTRLLWRRANQAAELARALARLAGVPADPGLLTRVRATPLQGSHGGFAGRAKNVQGAFRVPAAAGPRLRGRSVVIVDDVWTSGATVMACGKALLAAGAGKVAAVTVARVVRLESAPL
jgi:ComF family protein